MADKYYGNINEDTITSESDFPAPSLGVITLDSSTIYKIQGDVVITNKIDCNGATLLGRDRTLDKITSTQAASEIFTGNGQIIAKNLTFSITGAGSKLFNLLGTTGFEYVFMQDCTFTSNSSLGTIENYYAVQFINIPNQAPAGGLTLTDILNISLRYFDTSVGHTASTLLTLTGNSNLVQIFGCAFGVGGGQTAIDITGLTLATYGEISAGSGFSGAGTYVTGTFSALWDVIARGLNRISDSEARGACYVSSALATTIGTINVPVKVAGTTTLASTLRFTNGGSSNRLQYTGLKTVIKKISAAISTVSAASNKEYTWSIFKNGSLVVGSGIKRKQGTSTDVGALALDFLVSFDTNDYVEVWVANNTDTTAVTAQNLVLVVS
jgi:hypothetical protein